MPTTAVFDFYLEKNDPIVSGWNNGFPGLFESGVHAAACSHTSESLRISSMSGQSAEAISRGRSRIFYSGDDVWQVPSEIYGGEKVSVEPYHVTAQIQGNDSSEFLLLQPLTPLARPNLTAWLAARNDGEHYGDLELIDFPKDKNILGQEQVQALIHQVPRSARSLASGIRILNSSREIFWFFHLVRVCCMSNLFICVPARLAYRRSPELL